MRKREVRARVLWVQMEGGGNETFCLQRYWYRGGKGVNIETGGFWSLMNLGAALPVDRTEVSILMKGNHIAWKRLIRGEGCKTLKKRLD